MLKLKLQYFGHLMQRADSLGKTLILGKIEGRRRREWQKMSGWMASSTQWTWVWARFKRQWRTRKPPMLLSMGSQRVRHDWVTEQQWSSYPAPGNIFWKYENSNLKRYMHSILVAALFILTKTWEQPKCPSRDDWFKKTWYTHTPEYYSALESMKHCHLQQHEWT